MQVQTRINIVKDLFILLRGVITLLWNGLFTPFYSLVCMLASWVISPAAAYAVGRLWSRHLLALGGVKATVNGLEKIKPKQKYIVVSNHQSHLDISTLMVNLPLQLVFIAKKELFAIPFFGWGIKALGHIAINRDSARSARECILAASQVIKTKAKISLVIFPEGTRSPDGRVHEFKQGSFALALATGLPVLPVAITGTYQALPKTSLLVKPAPVTIQVGEVIVPTPADKHNKERLAQAAYRQIAGLLART